MEERNLGRGESTAHVSVLGQEVGGVLEEQGGVLGQEMGGSGGTWGVLGQEAGVAGATPGPVKLGKREGGDSSKWQQQRGDGELEDRETFRPVGRYDFDSEGDGKSLAV